MASENRQSSSDRFCSSNSQRFASCFYYSKMSVLDRRHAPTAPPLAVLDDISTAYDDLLFLWRSRETVIEMLTDRKHVFSKLPERYSDERELAASLLDDGETAKEMRSKMRLKSRIGGKRHVVVWTATLSISFLRELQFMAFKGDDSQQCLATRSCLVVHKEPIRAPAQATLKSMKIQGFRIEIVEEADVQRNITKHALVPQHTILTDEEVQRVLDQYRIKLHQLPKLEKTDKVKRWYGAKRGTVFRILRPSDTDPAFKSIYYRVVE